MNLTKTIKEVIFENFKAGRSVMWLSRIYVQRPDKIEKVIRSAIKDLESSNHQLTNDVQASRWQKENQVGAKPPSSMGGIDDGF